MARKKKVAEPKVENLYVVMAVQEWGFESTNFPFSIKFDARGMVGYLPLYADRETAEREHPGAAIVVLEKTFKG